jgi:hypothetical protein
MIKQTRTYTAPAGHTNVVTIADWAETLSPEDKKVCYQGINYQKSRVKTLTALNKLLVRDKNNGIFEYEWDSAESLAQFKNDTIYETFHARYLSETGITLTITTEIL